MSITQQTIHPAIAAYKLGKYRPYATTEDCLVVLVILGQTEYLVTEWANGRCTAKRVG